MFKGFVQDARCDRYIFTWVLLLGSLVRSDRLVSGTQSLFVLWSGFAPVIERASCQRRAFDGRFRWSAQTLSGRLPGDVLIFLVGAIVSVIYPLSK